MIQNQDLADEILRRLNEMIADPIIRKDIGRLIETRVPCSKSAFDHPTLQVGSSDDPEFNLPAYQISTLGFLNGIVGSFLEGPKKGWGHIAACFDDNGHLVRFIRTQDAYPSKEG